MSAWPIAALAAAMSAWPIAALAAAMSAWPIAALAPAMSAWPIAALAGALLAAGLVELGASSRHATRRPRRPRALAAVMAVLGRRLGRRAPASLAARIDAAGVWVGVGEVMAVKAACVPAAALAALSVASLAPGRLGTALAVLAPAAGFMAPDAWLRARSRARARRMEAEEADVLELLRVAVGAGLSPWRALAEVGRRHPGLLAGELAGAARRVALGVPAEQALTRLERRCPTGGMPSLAAVLRRADRLGASPGRALAALAAEARAREARRAAERAAKAAPKIQLVVALLLVPSVLLLVAAALVPALGAPVR
jgi:tight adherence protein C